MTAVGGGAQAHGHPTRATTRLSLSADLDDADRDALEQACSVVRTVSTGTNLRRQDTRTNSLHILLDGWAARFKIMREGGRFITTLAVPGDICDADALRFDTLGYGVTMLSPGTVVVLPRQQADSLFASHPAIANAFWSLTLVDNAILEERASSIARLSASHRIARLLCELLLRLTAVGKADGHSYGLPLTQEQIGDATGLTAVHVNRTLQSLRSMQLVTVQSRRVTIHDWAALRAYCGFRSSYLHLETVDAAFTGNLPAVDYFDGRTIRAAAHTTLR